MLPFLLLAALLIPAPDLNSPPPGVDPCTDPFYYVANYENPQSSPPGCPVTGQCAVYLRMYAGTPGGHSQYGSDHAWVVEDVKFRYAIIGQKSGSNPNPRIYPRPPLDATFARPVWDACVNQHQSPAPPHGPTSGGYFCDGSIHPDGGSTTYVPITLAVLATANPALWRSFSLLYNCNDATPTPTPTRTATVPPPCPTCAATCPPPTRTPTPHLGPAPTPSRTP